MRESEFWARLGRPVGESYARVWSDQQVIRALGGRTVREALDAGVPVKTVWRGVCDHLELSSTHW